MPTIIDGEEYLNQKEAAAYLRKSSTATNNYLKRFGIQRYKAGGRDVYVKKSDLDRTIALKPLTRKSLL